MRTRKRGKIDRKVREVVYESTDLVHLVVEDCRLRGIETLGIVQVISGPNGAEIVVQDKTEWSDE